VTGVLDEALPMHLKRSQKTRNSFASSSSELPESSTSKALFALYRLCCDLPVSGLPVRGRWRIGGRQPVPQLLRGRIGRETLPEGVVARALTGSAAAAAAAADEAIAATGAAAAEADADVALVVASDLDARSCSLSRRGRKCKGGALLFTSSPIVMLRSCLSPQLLSGRVSIREEPGT